MLNTAVILLAGCGILAGTRCWLGQRRWARRTLAMRADLAAAQRSLPASPVDFHELDALPPPVRRYLRTALQDGASRVAAVDIRHAGRFNLASQGQRWRPFTASQRVAICRPGFVWDARIRLLPGVDVWVHDACVAGAGLLEAALAGCVPLTRLHGTAELATGELMRFLAESPWYPTALLPGQGVRWDAVDERTARATLADGDVSAELLFRFGDDALPDTVYAEARGRMIGSEVVPTPWEGRWKNYAWRDGMCVPLEGEVAWLAQQGPLPYWRGQITQLVYEFSG